MREILKKAAYQNGKYHPDGKIKELFILQSNTIYYRIIIYTRDEYAGKVFKNIMGIDQNQDIRIPIKGEIKNWEEKTNPESKESHPHKLTKKQCFDLIFKDIMDNEDPENFTEEFRDQVHKTIKKIREVM